jgi:hypothetical protein
MFTMDGFLMHKSYGRYTSAIPPNGAISQPPFCMIAERPIARASESGNS